MPIPYSRIPISFVPHHNENCYNEINNWISPRLGIRFDLAGEELKIYRPDGVEFLSYNEIYQQLNNAQQQLNNTQEELNNTQRELEVQRQKTETLLAILRENGIDTQNI